MKKAAHRHELPVGFRVKSTVPIGNELFEMMKVPLSQRLGSNTQPASQIDCHLLS
jgi:hypothetical protein